MKINKLCILLITGAVIGSVQAQTDKGGISPQQLEEIKKKGYAGTDADRAIRNAIINNDINKLAVNRDNMNHLDTHFSHRVKSKGITNQKSSGRC